MPGRSRLREASSCCFHRAHLPLEEAVRAAEVGQPDRGGVDGVQRDERVDHALADGAGPLGAERLQLRGSRRYGVPSTRSMT